MFFLFSFTRATYNYRHYQFKSSALQELKHTQLPIHSALRGGGFKASGNICSIFERVKRIQDWDCQICSFLHPLLQRTPREKLITKKPRTTQVQNYWLHPLKWYYRNTGKHQAIEHAVMMCLSRGGCLQSLNGNALEWAQCFCCPNGQSLILCLRLRTLLD